MKEKNKKIEGIKDLFRQYESSEITQNEFLTEIKIGIVDIEKEIENINFLSNERLKMLRRLEKEIKDLKEMDRKADLEMLRLGDENLKLQKEIEELKKVCRRLSKRNVELMGAKGEFSEQSTKLKKEINKLKDYITKIRPKADCYDRICKTLGIKSNVLGFIKKLKEGKKPK